MTKGDGWTAVTVLPATGAPLDQATTAPRATVTAPGATATAPGATIAALCTTAMAD